MIKHSHSNKIPVIITGANGQVGQAVHEALSIDKRLDVLAYDSKSLDISDHKKVYDVFKKYSPKYVINAAAYTNVDRAETNQKQAYLINAEAPIHMAKLCKIIDCHLIHFSSDYVYDSITGIPISESDACTPKSVYAKSKLHGDNGIILACSHYTIVRTSWVYGSNGNNFVKTMLRLSESYPELKIVNDQVGAPTFAEDIADVTYRLLTKIENDGSLSCTGIYNYCHAGKTTWANFAKKIFEITKKEINVIGISTESYGAPAPRPRWSVLSTDKIENLLGVRTTEWDIRLFDFLRKYY